MAFVGPPGGGQTTVSRLAAQFWDLNRGKVTVGGMDISNIDPETLLSLYSVVFQDVTLFDNTILENIRIGNKDATDEKCWPLPAWPMWMNLRKSCQTDGTAIPLTRNSRQGI